MTAKTRKAKFKRIQRSQVKALRVKQRSEHVALMTPFITPGPVRSSHSLGQLSMPGLVTLPHPMPTSQPVYETVDYADMPVTNLRLIAQDRTIRMDGKRPSRMSKAELVAALLDDDKVSVADDDDDTDEMK